MTAEQPGLWTSRETAEWLAVTERMIRRLVQERRIPFVRVGKFIRFRPEDVERWRDQNLQPVIELDTHPLAG